MKAAPTQRLQTVLLVDDTDEFRLTTKWFLGTFGYAVESAHCAEVALALFNPKVHDVVITENRMSGMSGAELAHIIKLRSPSTPVLMYTASPPDDRSCLDVVVQRPMHLLVVKEAVDRLVAPHA